MLYLKTRTMAIPCSKALRMLGCYTCSCTIWPSKYNGNVDLSKKCIMVSIFKIMLYLKFEHKNRMYRLFNTRLYNFKNHVKISSANLRYGLMCYLKVKHIHFDSCCVIVSNAVTRSTTTVPVKMATFNGAERACCVLVSRNELHDYTIYKYTGLDPSMVRIL